MVKLFSFTEFTKKRRNHQIFGFLECRKYIVTLPMRPYKGAWAKRYIYSFFTFKFLLFIIFYALLFCFFNSFYSFV